MNIDNMMDKVYVLTPTSKTARPEGYFTAAEFAEKTGMTYSRAKDKLLALFRAGKVERIAVNESGHNSYVYGIPDEN